MADRILDYRSRFSSAGKVLDQAVFAELQLQQAQQKGLMERHVVLGDSDKLVGPPALAQVNSCHLGGRFGQVGRWLALCDEDDVPGACSGAEYVDLRRPRFMCCSCFNVRVGYRWRRIVLPREREQIERLLLERPDPLNHCWLPHETLAELEDQNLVLAAARERMG